VELFSLFLASHLERADIGNHGYLLSQCCVSDSGKRKKTLIKVEQEKSDGGSYFRIRLTFAIRLDQGLFGKLRSTFCLGIINIF